MRIAVVFIFSILLFACGGSKPEQEESDTEYYVDTNRVVDSMSYFDRKLQNDPRNPLVRMERAKYYKRTGQVALAMDDIKIVLAADSNIFEAQKMYADIHLAILDIETAKYHYEYILELDSTHAGALLGLAKVYGALSNFGTADAYISRSLKSNPYSPEPYFTRGMIYRADYEERNPSDPKKESSFDIALSSFQTAIEQESDYFPAYIALGVMYDSKDDSLALEYYNSALDIYPESLEAWYNKGFYYQKRGKVDNALDCYWTLKDLDTTWTRPLFNIGYIHLIMTQEHDSAIHYFKKVIEMDPLDFEAHNNLGLSWEQKGDKLNAKKYYERALEINPEYTLARENLNAL